MAMRGLAHVTTTLGICLIPVALLSAGSGLGQDPRALPGADFFSSCALVCVDVQPGAKYEIAEQDMPEDWRASGVTVDDVNAAIVYTFDIAYPNAARVVTACRGIGLPVIFVHWGYLFPDGMDLDPLVRESFMAQHGADPSSWPHHISSADSRPAEILDVREGDYVIAKTGQDAFASSNLGFVLENLGVQNVVFIGGHTGACLGATAESAKTRGYGLLCVQDATFAAFESLRAEDLRSTGYDYVVSTLEFERLASAVAE
jgi:nicotinamidase-related amidase